MPTWTAATRSPCGSPGTPTTPRRSPRTRSSAPTGRSPRYEPERIRELRIRPWLATIVLNLCRNRARSGTLPTDAARAARGGRREPAADAGTDPAGIALRTADRERLAAQLAALPERYRVPVVLRHVDDLSYAELAAVLGRPEGTLKAQVHRGLALLRAAMAATELEELTA